MNRRQQAARRGKCNSQILHVEQRHYALSERRGSTASRNPSPRRLTPSTVSVKKPAGMNTRYGFTCHSALPSDMILPHDGIVGGVPAPMNDRLASMTMAAEPTNVAWTVSGEIT